MSSPVTPRPWRALVRLAPLVLTAACSIVNRIDACEQPALASYEADLRTDGSQALDGVEPLAALPDRGGSGAAATISGAVCVDGAARAASRVAGSGA